jgi:hypothetical protein
MAEKAKARQCFYVELAQKPGALHPVFGQE